MDKENKANSENDRFENYQNWVKDTSAVSELSLDDLSGDLKEVAQCIGIEPVKKLILNFGGYKIHIPKASSLDSLVEKFYYNSGKNEMLTARTFNLGRRTIQLKQRNIWRLNKNTPITNAYRENRNNNKE
jgi:hypothetical protein